MPDRRQRDRRENSGFESKKITISLPVFILSVTICLLVFISVLVCTYFSRTSYNKGYMDCYKSVYGYDDYDLDDDFEEDSDIDFSADED